MIDLHCHILPGLDDGAGTLTESLAMGRIAEKEGIRKIVATPHHSGARLSQREDIIDSVKELNKSFQQEGIQVEVLPGHEVGVYEGLLSDLRDGIVLPINRTSEYLFLELPNDHIPRYVTNLLFDLQIEGYKPIIVHPERNIEFQENPDKLYRMVKAGALTQITASSLVGKLGKKVERFAYQLIDANLTNFISSDAHRAKKRTFHMRDAFKQVKKRYGNKMAYLFMENSEAVLNGDDIFRELPERVATKKKWVLFG